MAKKYELKEEAADIEALARQMQGIAEGKKRRQIAEQASRLPKWIQNPLTRGVFFGALMAIALMGAGIFAFPNLRQIIAPKTTVPNLIGQSSAGAKSILEKQGLRVKIESAPANAKAAPGTVIAMKPTPGMRVAAASDVITLTIAIKVPHTEKGPATGKDPEKIDPPKLAPDPNKAPEEVKHLPLPDVESVVDAKAISVLEAKGFKVTTTAKQDPAQPNHIVLSSDPKPDTLVEPGITVHLVVNNLPASTQPEQTNGNLIPLVDYAGRNGRTVITDLANLGFNVTYAVEASRLQASGNVIRTDPLAGSHLQKGSEVKVIIAQ